VIHDLQGQSLISTVRAEQPDVVLMDIFLAGADGLDLLADLRAEEDLAETRVVMTSGMELSQQAALAGADAFLLKPYTPDQLTTAIRGKRDRSSSG
jgi:CheY-like chemotaxis protein